MKKNVLILFLLITCYSFSQSVNDYKAVVIPLKYDFQKSENQYRLQTITKLNLNKAGFQALYSNEANLSQFPDRCSLLYIDVKKENAFLATKLFIVFKDCYGAVVYQSPIGKSKEKEFETAFTEALNDAFVNVYALHYNYNGNTNFSPKGSMAATSLPTSAPQSTPVTPISDAAVATATVVMASPSKAFTSSKNESKIVENKSVDLLYAQPTSYGYQLIDSEPKVVMKVYKTSNPNSFMAKKGDVQGALVSKENQWFFEYYQNDKLISEKVEVKF